MRAVMVVKSRAKRAGAVALVAALVGLVLVLVGPVGADTDTAQLTTGPFAVDVTNREAVRRLYQSVYQASQNIDPGWTGNVANCTPGTLSATYLEATLSRVNWYRAMAGVSSNITFTAEKNALAQAAGLLQAAQPEGTGLNHLPPNTWRCWTQAGFDGSSLSNLGGTGPGAIDGWILDPGDNNVATGHRRHILNPDQLTMGHGGVPGSWGALHVLGQRATPRPAARDEFVAWPNRGFVPNTVVWPRWSFFLPPSANVDNATVTMRRAGVDMPVTVIHRSSNTGYGDSAVNWRPTAVADDQSSWPAPANDETISVTVGNVVMAGVTRTFTYDVTIFDPQVADPSRTQPVISGPVSAPLNQATPYTFNAVPNATGYQWRSTKVSPLLAIDGAENGLVNFDAVTDGYNPVSTTFAASGGSSFRLTVGQGTTKPHQTLTFKQTLFPAADGTVTFKSRANGLTNVTGLLEASPDGTTWTTLFTETATADTAFTAHTVSFGALAGRQLQVRFRLDPAGTGNWACCGSEGWYLDDVAFSNVEVAAAPVLSAVGPATTTGFSFTPGEQADFLLEVRPDFFATGFGPWGPVKRVSSAPPPVAPAITGQPVGVTVAAGAPVTLSVVATGTAPLQFAWQRDGAALVDGTGGVSGSSTANLTVTPAAAGSYTVTIRNQAGVVTSNPAVVVVTQPPTLTLGDAVDNPALAFTNGGDAPWAAQRATTHDGVDAAQSGRIVDGQSSVLQTTVNGPVTVGFWWKVSSEQGFDFLDVSIDGAPAVDRLSGEVDWAAKTINIPAGAHVVRWTYAKDGSVSNGADAAWIDQVTVAAVAAPLTLNDALDTGLALATSGNAVWVAERTTTHDGVDAGQSGRLVDSQSSVLQVAVNGPVTLGFWWKVSSEQGFDFLTVSIDAAAPVDRISGEVDWAEKTLTVPAGSHVVRWTFAKDDSVSNGADAAWIDQLRLV